MGSVKEVEIIKNPSEKTEGEGEFRFSDRYSVFDWGEMPDLIPDKGAALCVLSSHFFELLEQNGIKTHFLGLVEQGSPKKLNDLNKSSNIMRVRLVRVIKPPYDEKSNSYDYSAYTAKQNNFLIPLEVIYRNRLTAGSSVFKRIQNGSVTYRELGLEREPAVDKVLNPPLLDVSTKLEHTDRYLLWDEAEKISGLSAGDMKKVKEMIVFINSLISGECAKAGIENVDGKFEFGVDSSGSIMVVDVLGTPDECRFLYDGFHISKEITRRWYRKTPWYEEVESAKKEKGKGWKDGVNPPPKLPAEMKTLVSQMY
ncbi:MAG TPA: phosphoribosylaminoimidazolesuccinocarboxamide synthase, partial [bacterium]|nr:phosphoribosylaminoimidazolesuccinocarboxamide synthase [bacterium]